MLKAVKIRLYPNKEQSNYINSLLGSYRKVYNLCLDKKMTAYLQDKSNLGLKELGSYFHNELTKSDEYSYLNQHNTKVLKQSIMNLMEAYKRFFVNGNGFPKFKSKHDKTQSCRFPLEAISKLNDYTSNKLSLGGIKNLKFECSDKYKNYLLKYKTGIRSATLSKTKTDKYFLSILVDGDIDKFLSKPTNNIIGIDLGVKTFVVDSEGNEYENIKIKRNNEKKISYLHYKLSKTKKDGKNREKVKIKLAKHHEKLNNIKINYLHHITNKLLNENQVIVIEDLNVSGMMRNHCLAKSIQELSLYEFKRMLNYKAGWYKRTVIEVDRYFPSTKLCSDCGYKNDNLTLRDREWACPSCGVKHNRDFNSAVNLKKEGLRLLKDTIPTRCGE